MLGRTDDDGRRLVADGVRQEFGALRAALEQAAGAASRRRDLMLRAPGDLGAARDLFAALAAIGDSRVAITVYGSDAAPLAWSGRPSELPGAQDQRARRPAGRARGVGTQARAGTPSRRRRQRAGPAGRHRRRRSRASDQPVVPPPRTGGAHVDRRARAGGASPRVRGRRRVAVAGSVRPDRPRRQVAPRGPGAHRRCRHRATHDPGPDAGRALRADGPVPGMAVGPR